MEIRIYLYEAWSRLIRPSEIPSEGSEGPRINWLYLQM